MVEKEYSIDIIITQLALHEEGIYSGLIKFTDYSIEVPAFALPNEFRFGRSITLQSTPQSLQNKLESSPVVLEIIKDESTFGMWKRI
jgi:hypothetical protein